MLLTSVTLGFYPRSESRKGDTACHEGGYTESVRNSVNHFKPLANTLAWLLFPPLWCAYLLQYHLQFQCSQVNELNAETAFPIVALLGTVSKTQKRRDSEQECLCVPGFYSLPWETNKAQSHRRGPNCSSEPQFCSKGIQVNPSPPLFPCRAAHSSPCAQPTALAREQQGWSRGCFCLLLHASSPSRCLLHGVPSPSNAQQGRLKVTLPFLSCGAEWGLWHFIPAGSFPPAVNRHWAHTLAASSACWTAAAPRPGSVAFRLSLVISFTQHKKKRDSTGSQLYTSLLRAEVSEEHGQNTSAPTPLSSSHAGM